MSALTIPISPFQPDLDADQLAELIELRDEVTALRLRDATIKQYMERFDEEMRLAARLQRDFLPKSLPKIGSIRFSTLFRPAGYVSGDLYDVMRIDEENVGFYIADAVGHGMPAALLTMFIKNALVTKEIVGDGYRLLRPGASLGRINDALVAQNLENATFATALYGRVNVNTGDVLLARGGHPTPVLLRADGSAEAPTADGCLLGIFQNETFPDCAFRLEPGDRLFVFTDGIEVCFGGGKVIDAAAWVEELQRRASSTTRDILAEFDTQLSECSGSLDAKDDLTIIVVERLAI